MIKAETIIPPMTDPLGKAWEQPSLDQIGLFETGNIVPHAARDGRTVELYDAIMTKEAFDKLKDYSHSKPSGVYSGKMWKMKGYKDKWFLCYFGEKFKDKGEEYFETNYYTIIGVLKPKK